jgi:hypothetical protein
MDHSVEPPVRVALKFMKYRDQFDREVIAAGMLDALLAADILY